MCCQFSESTYALVRIGKDVTVLRSYVSRMYEPHMRMLPPKEARPGTTAGAFFCAVITCGRMGGTTSLRR